jgi:GH15 family glucan-1,4-alpha-glucosidase
VPEQVHPLSGQPVSVAPLTWSHATIVIAIREYLAKHAKLK